jgi:ribonucleoside-diphosphate reductase alpha chain
MPKIRGIEPELTDNALTVLNKRYLWKDDAGQVTETPQEMFWRVAQAVAIPEGRRKAAWAARFYDAMADRRFIPNSPTLMNAGRAGGQLSACFVLPVADSLGAIFNTLRDAAKIHQSGGGTGFAFSKLRAEGSPVRSTSGVASGPVSFIRIFDVATETIKQGGARRGANMAVLRADHPDIVEFVDSKRDQKSIVNFNLSVGATAEFMESVRRDLDFALRDPRDGRETGRIRGRELFERICQSAWECGDPGMVFLDRMNVFNPTPSEGDMESTNPCGEQPLLAYESCNLGSLNLGRYAGRGAGEVNWKALVEDIGLAVRFLDDVIEINEYPVAESAKITLKNRKIGLGVMGFADLLLVLGIPYDSAQGVLLGERIMSVVDREAKRSSAVLAAEKGAFPNYRKSMWRRLGYPPLRNATVSTVAPTGTISMIAGASSGIEPIFAGIFHRNVLSGARLREVHPSVERALAARGRSGEKISEADLLPLIGPAWSPARSVSIAGHVRMQAAFQRFSDSAVSKTINLPESATAEDIGSAFRMAYEAGCKGITVYRDRSKPTQVLEAGGSESDSVAGAVCRTC